MKTKYEFKKAVKLYLLEGTKIKILFSDGKTILFDIENVFERLPEYRVLKDRSLFLKAKLDGWGGIKWTPSLDLSVDTVYYEGKEIESEENASMLILGFTIKEKRLEKNLTQKEKKLDEKLKKAEDKAAQLDKMEEDLQSRIDGQIALLERVSNMSQEEARSELMEVIEKKMQTEVANYIREQEEEAKEKALETSREIIATAIQRYSQDETLDRTVSVVTLPSEEMKGRIIGREGRNIRAIEQATGVDLIIDDTPEAITVSCFDPIRREIARLSLETLIRDGRIQPGRIEDVVEKTAKDMETTITKLGEDACFKLQIGKMDKELVKLIGRMRYRYSYGQNGLEHSVEVASFAGMMAAELGLNQNLAKRAGLLHDIGKAVDFEQEGTHVELGAKLAKKYGERPEIINAIESHHGDVEPNNLYSYLVAAADTLSAARPGARYEGIENYINRLESLEKIANEFGIATIIRSGDVIELAMKKLGDCYDEYGFHMNYLGNYLIGLNLVKTLTGKKIDKIYQPDGFGFSLCEKCVSFINKNF